MTFLQKYAGDMLISLHMVKTLGPKVPICSVIQSMRCGPISCEGKNCDICIQESMDWLREQARKDGENYEE